VPLNRMKSQFWVDMQSIFKKTGSPEPPAASADSGALSDAGTPVDTESSEREGSLGHGSVVIAAITSCTNTSNPSVLLSAGLLAKRAVELGLRRNEYVKTSLAPGSKVVTRYLKRAGLLKPLEELGFYLVGYGCTTCIGNSGPLPEDVIRAIETRDLVVASVLSGNRNFEGRINPHTRASYLASPPLVVAYALAGRVDIDFETEPLGRDNRDRPVYLRDIWPAKSEVDELVRTALEPELFIQEYKTVYTANETWNSIEVPKGKLFDWDPDSTYIREPSFFDHVETQREPVRPIRGARVLLKLADSVTTDHISPAGSIAEGSPASRYLEEHGVMEKDYNSYGSRRGNHEVMIRGTFANIRIRNEMLAGVEGGYALHLPSNETLPVYDAAVRYAAEGVPLLVIAGKDYGSGSSRDWAAKGTQLLGVRAVIAESFERIHRSNLVQFGVLPLEFEPGVNRDTLGLTGFELYEVDGLTDDITPHKRLTVKARGQGGETISFDVTARLDTPVDVIYYQNGGVLHTVFRRWLNEAAESGGSDDIPC
jgi:aconitate hydratase